MKQETAPQFILAYISERFRIDPENLFRKGTKLGIMPEKVIFVALCLQFGVRITNLSRFMGCSKQCLYFIEKSSYKFTAEIESCSIEIAPHSKSWDKSIWAFPDIPQPDLGSPILNQAHELLRSMDIRRETAVLKWHNTHTKVSTQSHFAAKYPVEDQYIIRL